MSNATIRRYLERHGVVAEGLGPPPDGLRGCVVIPAKAERDNLPEVVASLSPLPDWAELIVVINNGVDPSPRVVQDNRRTARWLDDVERTVVIDRFSPGQEVVEGGVGHARRLGMDTALRRLLEAGAVERGFIACLDADSPVDDGYLDALASFFADRPDVLVGVCHYEHRLGEDPALADAIVEYETWLRYWEEGHHAARSPYAFQTIGSCIVATAVGYARIDGMQQMDAGEDFYFVEKAVKHGGPGAVRTIDTAVVRPSARPSRRVPFGTGRALADILDGRAEKYRKVPPASAFADLRQLMESVDELFAGDEVLERLAPELTRFLMQRCGGTTTIAAMRDTAPDAARFARSFHAWFSALRQIQYANEVADVRGAEPPAAVCAQLLGLDEVLEGRELLALLRSRAAARDS